MTLPEAAHFGGAKRPVKERPLVPPLIDDRPMLKTTTSGLYPPRPVVPFSSSDPVKSSSTLYVFTSANLDPCPHQPLAAWAMIKEQFTAFCVSLLPWLGPLVYRDGVTPPLNPGRPPERAGESTRTPLISPEKLALTRPARGAPLASSLVGFTPLSASFAPFSSPRPRQSRGWHRPQPSSRIQGPEK